MTDSPSDKAIERSAKENILPPSRRSAEVMSRYDQKFMPIMHAIEEHCNYTVRDYNKVKIFMYENRKDWLINIYELDKQEGVEIPNVFEQYKIRSFRVFWTDENTIDRVEGT